jgi:hypothetical protein
MPHHDPYSMKNKMRTRAGFAATLLALTLIAGCGGGGGGGESAAGGQAATYTFVRPKLGTRLVYGEQLVDNRNNTVNRTIVENVTAVNADGSFAVHEEDPSHNQFFSGTVDQTAYPTDYQYNASGQPLSWVVNRGNGVTVSCVISGGLSGAPSTLASGQGWTTSYTQTCGSGTGTAFNQTGTLVGLETVTVPAGTFSAFKFTTTVTMTANGTTRTETVTRWRDASGADSHVLKSTSVFSYSGTAPASGALVSESRELQSAQ